MLYYVVKEEKELALASLWIRRSLFFLFRVGKKSFRILYSIRIYSIQNIFFKKFALCAEGGGLVAKVSYGSGRSNIDDDAAGVWC